MPRPLRALRRLWYCRIRGVHDWWAFAPDKWYGWKRCSLCDAKRENTVIETVYLGDPRWLSKP